MTDGSIDIIDLMDDEPVGNNKIITNKQTENGNEQFNVENDTIIIDSDSTNSNSSDDLSISVESVIADVFEECTKTMKKNLFENNNLTLEVRQ